jgi:dipeptidase
MCDCVVALGSEAARGATLFGKNSDREKLEAQPLRALARAEHAPGSRVRATYLELPQARETFAVLGSGPHWCWGLEQGVNEHGVVIGNETVFTHEELELPAVGLLGMDLVRLALERTRSAREAVETLGALIEAHGQGGPGFMSKTLPYSNGFLVGDAREAWSVQTSSRRWVARRVRGVGAISNHPSIGADWELGSADVERFACERGWWSPERGRLDFEAAYRSTRLVSAVFSEARLARSSALLAKARGSLDERGLCALLRDHGDGARVPSAVEKSDPAYWTLCAHNDVMQDTTASMVVALDRPERWLALAAPCTSVYLPLYVGARLPAALTLGGAEPDAASAWWRFKRLQQVVERDFARRLPVVRERFDALEREWLAATGADDPAGRIEHATALALETAETLLRRFEP